MRCPCSPLDAPWARCSEGQLSAECGQTAFEYVRAAIELALAGKLSGIVTAPIHKEALAAASVPFPGHTEMLARFAGVDEVAMMLVNDRLKIVLVSIHCSLREAVEAVSEEAVLKTIRLAHTGAKAFRIDTPSRRGCRLEPTCWRRRSIWSRGDRVDCARDSKGA